MKVIKKIGKILLITLLVIVVLAGGFFGYLTLAEYSPEDPLTLEVKGAAGKKMTAGTAYTAVSWNIGFGALGDNTDFFMDGGKNVVTADKARVEQNMRDIAEKLTSFSPDLILLQEADLKSARSHRINEVAQIEQAFPAMQSAFAYNFKVAFVPYPLPPIGHVESGLATLSSPAVTSASRLTLPCPFTWPTRTANLKRCLLVSRLPVEGSDKELLLVNLHLEAYDDGEGKIEQTKVLRRVLDEELEKGNYVIAGGDFNQTFSNIDYSMYPQQEGLWESGLINVSDFAEGWQFIMTNEVPSCRSLDKVYTGADLSTFQYYLLDGFIVSPNITVESFEVADLGFVSTDHNPAILRFTLNP